MALLLTSPSLRQVGLPRAAPQREGLPREPGVRPTPSGGKSYANPSYREADVAELFRGGFQDKMLKTRKV